MGKNMVMFLKNFGEAFGYQLLGDITKYSCTIVYSLYIDYIYTFTNTCIYIYIHELFVCACFRTSIQLCCKYHNMIVGFYLQLCVLHPSKLPKVCGSGWSNDQRKLISQRPVSVLRSCPRPPPKKMNECHLKRDHFKRKTAFQPAFLSGYVGFPGSAFICCCFHEGYCYFQCKDEVAASERIHVIHFI